MGSGLATEAGGSIAWQAAHAAYPYLRRLAALLGMPGMDPEEPPPPAHLIRVRHIRTGRLLVHRTGEAEESVGLSAACSSPPNALFRPEFGAPGVDELALHAAGAASDGHVSPDADTRQLELRGAGAGAAPRFALARAARAPAVALRPAAAAADPDAHLCVAGRGGDARIALRARADAPHAQWALSVAPGARGAPRRRTAVRVQAGRNGQFLACARGARAACQGARDLGWDVFALEEDAAGGATLADAAGAPLVFTDDLRGLRAADAPGARAERFALAEADGDGARDDRVTLRSRKGFLSVARDGALTLEQDRPPGRNEQFALRVALPSMLACTAPRRALRTGPGGVRVVEASVDVPVDAAVAYGVITDYEGFPRFVADAAESEVLERVADRRLRVRMVQSHSFLVLTLNLGMELAVEEFPEEGCVTMEMKKGFGVREYRGTWSATQKTKGSCLLSVEIAAAPAIPAPGFLIDGVISHATTATLVQVRAECIRRVGEKKGVPSRSKSGNGS